MTASLERPKQLQPEFPPAFEPLRCEPVAVTARVLPRSRVLEYWLFAAVIAASLLGGLVHLRSASIWYDELVTLLATSGHTEVDLAQGLQQFEPTTDLARILTNLYKRDVHPPLYFWTLALWRAVFGPSLEVARSLSLLFTAGTLALLYRYSLYLGLKQAWLPAAIYAASGAGVRYAYNARPYAMAVFLVVLTLFLVQRKSSWSGVSAAACVATHYFAALCVAPLLAAACAQRWRTDRRWAALTLGSFAWFCAPLMVLVKAHIGARPQQYPGFESLYLETCSLLKNSIAGAMPVSRLPGWSLVLSFGALLAFGGAWWAWKEKKLALPVGHGAFLCGFLLLAIATNKSLVKMPTDYYLGIGACWLAVLIGLGANAFPRTIPLLAIFLIAGSATAMPMGPTVDYRQMASEMRSECAQCPVLVGTGYVGATLGCLLYESKGNLKILPLDTENSATETLEHSGGYSIFLVPANDPDTTQVEQKLVHTYPSTQKDGFFEIDAHSTRKP